MIRKGATIARVLALSLQDGSTPLIVSAMAGKLQAIKFLLRRGADMELRGGVRMHTMLQLLIEGVWAFCNP